MSDSFQCLAFVSDERPSEISSFDEIESALQRHEDVLFFDVTNPESAEFDRLAALLELHPLAVEDARKAHQRPKIEPYRNSWFIVMHTATRIAQNLEIAEVAIFCGDRFVVAVHGSNVHLCTDVQQRWTQRRHEAGHRNAALLYAVFDTVVDSYMPIGHAIDKEIDVLEESLFTENKTTHELLLEVFEIKRDLSDFRRSVAPMREILIPIIRGEFEGFNSEDLAYFRDIDDHVARLIDGLDGARDSLVNAREAHIAFASHQQNEVTKQLSIVATIFLPLTFITGFFGQNFAWLNARVEGEHQFWLYGVGVEVIAVILLLSYFRHKRWF